MALALINASWHLYDISLQMPLARHQECMDYLSPIDVAMLSVYFQFDFLMKAKEYHDLGATYCILSLYMSPPKNN